MSSAPALTQQEWDKGLGAGASLLQSWGFGQAQLDEGWRVLRLELNGCRAQVLLQGSAGVRWAFVPRGPLPPSPEAIGELVEWARKEKLVRLRLEPEATGEMREVLLGMGFRPARAMHPEHTLIVPLGPEEQMLAACKPKHRYNIRLGQRRGVEVEEGDDVAELDRQHRQTAARQGIQPMSLAHYRRRLERLEWCRVYVARVEAEPVAAIMAARFAGRAYYLFGGSSERHRQLMPTYALQWAAMQAAWAGGCRDYDMWGLPPSADDSDHPWHGLWQFKTGFGGTMISYCGAWDLVLSRFGERLADPAGRVGRVLSGFAGANRRSLRL